MSWLADHGAIVPSSHHFEKRGDSASVESEGRRKLHEQWTAMPAEPPGFLQESIERDARSPEPQFMSDVLRYLHRKPEVISG